MKDLTVRIKILDSEVGEFVDMNAIIGVAPDSFVDEKSLIYKEANAFVHRVELALGKVIYSEDGQDFLLVFGESLEDAFIPFLHGSVFRELDKIASKLETESDKDGGDTEKKGDVGNVVILVCPIGDAHWYQKFIWGDEKKPACAGKYVVRVFDRSRFDDFRQWSKKGKVHAQECGE